MLPQTQTSSPSGSARRRREQSNRALAKHVGWLAGLLQSKLSHHTSGGGSSLFVESILKLQQEKIDGQNKQIEKLFTMIGEMQERIEKLSPCKPEKDEGKQVHSPPQEGGGTGASSAEDVLQELARQAEPFIVQAEEVAEGKQKVDGQNKLKEKEELEEQIRQAQAAKRKACEAMVQSWREMQQLQQQAGQGGEEGQPGAGQRKKQGGGRKQGKQGGDKGKALAEEGPAQGQARGKGSREEVEAG